MALTAPFLVGAAVAQDGRVAFDVPSQPARSGIIEFARQASIQILVSSEDVSDRQVRRLRGTMTVRDGLLRLLTSSGVTLVSFDGRTAVLATKPRSSGTPSGSRASAVGRSAARTARTWVGSPPRADSPPSTGEPSDDPNGDIVVTGYLRSLADEVALKRTATGFEDSIFAEDIGRFADVNIAESLNRVPGITISRDITGEGTNVAIRGLGSNFTQTTLNGAPLTVASSGITDAQGTDRSVDLGLFPTDLFTSLRVAKSYRADLVEGGASGNVDLRGMRPSDRPGTHQTASLTINQQSAVARAGYRASLITSTNADDVGVLLGVSAQRQVTLVRGYETVGWTNPRLAESQCDGRCNSTGGGNWTIPLIVPSPSTDTLVPGTPIDRDLLSRLNPAISSEQLDNGLVPRLGGPADEAGARQRVTTLGSVELHAADDLSLRLDLVWARRSNAFERRASEWVVRNGSSIPADVEVDRSDCARGCVVTAGMFANAQFYAAYRPYRERTTFLQAIPALEWTSASNVTFSAEATFLRSAFRRRTATVLIATSPDSGATVSYRNPDGVPTVSPSIDLNDPANYGWRGGGRVNAQEERRTARVRGGRLRISAPVGNAVIAAGLDYYDISRRISALESSQPWQNAVCGNGAAAYLPLPNTQPPCEGLDAPGTIPPGYPSYPGYGTGYTVGSMPPIGYAGSLIPASALKSYLRPGRDGYVTVDWDRFASVSRYALFRTSGDIAPTALTGAANGFVREKSPAVYLEAWGQTDVAAGTLSYDAGARLVATRQKIAGPVFAEDARNNADGVGVALDGSRYPAVAQEAFSRSGYVKLLPTLNLAYRPSQQVVARLALTRTMTRPDPDAQLPGAAFSSPSADVATVGTSDLKPYMSTNMDVGIEYYAAPASLLAATVFVKRLDGFIRYVIKTMPFSALSAYGISFETLNPTQQAAIGTRGGPTRATVQIQNPVNASGVLTVTGLELQWRQPLDDLLRPLGLAGFGLDANATVVRQRGTGAAPAVALGVAPLTYNLTAYYQRGRTSLRVSTTYQKGSQATASNQNGIPDAAVFTEDYRQWDLSGNFDLGGIGAARLQLIVEAVNITKARLKRYFQFANAPFTTYRPGRQVGVGLRATL